MNKDKKSRSKSTTRKSKAKEVKARGPTGWQLFLAEHRQAVKDKEEVSDREAMKLIGDMWHDLSEKEVDVYNKKAEEMTEEMIKNGEVDPDLAKSKKRKSPSKSKSKDKKKKDDKKKKNEDDDDDDDKKDKKEKNKDTKGKKPESNKNKKDNKKKKNAEEDDDDEE